MNNRLMGDYRDRCSTGLTKLDSFYKEMLGDLDTARGGFGWWHEYFDRPRTIFLSDYMLAVCEQASLSLVEAAWHEHVFRQAWYAETRWLRNQLKSDRPEALGERDEMDVERDARIETAIVGFFQACGSALDLLAALAIGTLGIKADVVTASWTTVVNASTGTGGLLAAPGAGRDAQEAALAEITRAADTEPPGWLGWTLDMRHLLVHRGRRMAVRQHYRSGLVRGEEQYVMLLPRDPQLTEIEALALAHDSKALVLREHAGDLMAGVLDRLNTLIAVSVDALYALWAQRRVDPDLIGQPAFQWSKLYPRRRDLSGFSGFNPAVPDPKGEMQLKPHIVRRLQVAKVFDSDHGFWPSELS